MKLLEKEEIVAKAPVAAPRHLAKPEIAVRGRFVAKPSKRRRNTMFQDFCARTVLFASVLGFTYIGSTLGGYVILERARQSARHGAERATYARAQAKQARESIETLTNPTALRAWAEERGFAAGGSSEGLVAQR